MSDFKIVHDRPACIGCGVCAAINPEHWEMSTKDGKSDVIGCEMDGTNEVLEIEELGSDMDAAEACPVNCIHLYEKDKKLI